MGVSTGLSFRIAELEEQHARYLKALKKLHKAAEEAYPVFGELTGGYVSPERKTEVLNSLIDCTVAAEAALQGEG